MGAGYVDECLWQVDRTGAAAFVLQDANFNVVALIDHTGTVLQQYDYDPYGEVLAADTLGSYANNRVGFQGLFTDRFDVDAPLPEMRPDSDTTYYARNRDYRPDLGSWVQRDPNGAGGVLLEAAARGDITGTSVESFGLLGHYADGLHSFALADSNPVVRHDPLGLFFGIIGVGLSALDTGMGMVDALEEVRQGLLTAFMTDAMTDDYAYNQEMDIEWALDWGQRDYEHSRAGAAGGAMLIGAKLARMKGKQTHHIATNSNTSHGRRMRRLFESAGLSIEVPENKVPMPHGGRHPAEYHRYVYDRLDDAIAGKKTPKARATALRMELKKIGTKLRKNPEFVYNTVRGKPTGWRGRRTWRRR